MKTNPNDSIQIQKYSEMKGSIAYHKETTGLTKREYFAALAMQSMADNDEPFDVIAKNSVLLADALILQLNATQEP